MSLSANVKVNHKELCKTKSHVERAHLYRAAHNASRVAPSSVVRAEIERKRGKEALRSKLLLKPTAAESTVAKTLKAKRVATRVVRK